MTIYELVRKDGVPETEEMKFMKFFQAMVLVTKKAEPEFTIRIDKTIEIGLHQKPDARIYEKEAKLESQD